MTDKEARKIIIQNTESLKANPLATVDDCLYEAFDKAIIALESHPTWIPVKDPLNELPKDRMLYVTTKFGDVETLVYDMTEWDDADVARCTIAYMDYYVPKPYKAESGCEADDE